MRSSGDPPRSVLADERVGAVGTSSTSSESRADAFRHLSGGQCLTLRKNVHLDLVGSLPATRVLRTGIPPPSTTSTARLSENVFATCIKLLASNHSYTINILILFFRTVSAAERTVRLSQSRRETPSDERRDGSASYEPGAEFLRCRRTQNLIQGGLLAGASAV